MGRIVSQVRRRQFLLAAGVFLVLPRVKAQQPTKRARVAWLGFTGPEGGGIYLEVFKQGLRDLGHVEGRDVVFEIRWAAGSAEKLAEFANELAALKPDVIVATTTVTARAAQRATATIPIVVGSSSDPVGGGLVRSLARPGGNVTGLSNLGGDVSPKLLEFLLAILPKLSLVSVLSNSSNPANATSLKKLRATVQKMGVKVAIIEVQTLAEIETAFANMARENVRAVIVLSDPLFIAHRVRIAELASRYRMPSAFGVREHVEAGGLMSYGQKLADQFQRAAAYVDKILKGAKPGDLPIEQATTLELVVNQTTAKALGITVPRSILLRADRVIE
jgi:putative tryptophan/tyrosine transport system substrate-binding protein